VPLGRCESGKHRTTWHFAGRGARAIPHLNMNNKIIADKPLTKKQTVQAERAKAIDYLRGDYLKAGDTVYTILRHVSASGMSRLLDVYCIKDNKPLRLTWNVAVALERTYDRRKEALRVSGAGEDVGFATVYHLSHTLFGDGYALQHRWL